MLLYWLNIVVTTFNQYSVEWDCVNQQIAVFISGSPVLLFWLYSVLCDFWILKAQYLFKEIVCFTSLWVENAYKLAAGAVVHNIICSNNLFYVVAVFCCVVYLVNAPRTSRLSVQCLRCTYITSIHIAWITLYIHNIQHCWRPIILIQTLHTPHTYTILLSFVYQVSVLRG